MSRYRCSIPRELKQALKGNPNLGRRTVYKFHHSQYTPSILEFGAIKIGNLTQYRDAEKIALKDDMENRDLTVIGRDGPVEACTFHPYNQIHKVFCLPPGGGHNVFHNVAVEIELPDKYVYCFSYDSSSSTLKSFEDADPYNAVVTCSDIFAVADLLCEHHPALRGSKYLCLPVVYRKRLRHETQPASSPVVHAFEKPISFQQNIEGRIVFLAPRQTRVLPPLDIWYHPDLRKLFHPHMLPS